MTYKFNRMAAIAPNETTNDDGNAGGITPETETTPQDEPLKEPGLKALQAERQQRKALEQQLRAIQSKFEGVDPSQFQELMDFKTQQEQAAAQQRQRELEEKQNYEAAKAQLVDEWTRKLTAAEKAKDLSISELAAEKTAIAQKYEDLLVTTQLNNAFVKANGDPSKIDVLAIPSIRGQLAIVDDAVVVVDAAGNATDKSVDLWMAEQVKPAYLYLFKPDNAASGGGTPPSQGSTGSVNKRNNEDIFSLSPAELAARSRRGA